MDYKLLVKTLDLNVGASWMIPDSADDFFPDPIGWKDIDRFRAEYLEQRQHRILQLDAVPHLKESVPKKSGMLREAVWLHPCHRIVYLAVLRRLLPKLDPRLLGSVYSYRCDLPDEPDEYQFKKRMNRWKDFHNDLRRTALADDCGAILVTDLASYFDHIQVSSLGEQIESLLAGSLDKGDKATVELLGRLLRLWGDNGFGMPHNLDPSSFFGGVYLHYVDQEMTNRKHKYFRWLDDIRIVAGNREDALRALHDLQDALLSKRLFLASDKTSIVEKGTDEFNRLMNVEDDIAISDAETSIGRGLRDELEQTAGRLLERLAFHASEQGDDRKFRAFANRLLDIADFEELETDIALRVREFVLPRLRSHPERTDYWAKMLLACQGVGVAGALNDLLIVRPSVFDWQRFHLWRLATHLRAENLPEGLLAKSRDVNTSAISENVAAQSIVFRGRHGNNTEREAVYAAHFSAQRSYVVQRAVLVAIQEHPNRAQYYRRALDTNNDHKQLVSYLGDREAPDYGFKDRSGRHCATEPREIEHEILRGIGLTAQGVRSYRLSRSDFGYE